MTTHSVEEYSVDVHPVMTTTLHLSEPGGFVWYSLYVKMSIWRDRRRPYDIIPLLHGSIAIFTNDIQSICDLHDAVAARSVVTKNARGIFKAQSRILNGYVYSDGEKR